MYAGVLRTVWEDDQRAIPHIPFPNLLGGCFNVRIQPRSTSQHCPTPHYYYHYCYY